MDVEGMFVYDPSLKDVERSKVNQTIATDGMTYLKGMQELLRPG